MLGRRTPSSERARWSTRTPGRRFRRLMMAGLVLVAVSACGVAVDGVGTAAPGPTPGTPPPADALQTPTTTAAPSATGDIEETRSAPFDVCGTITWADFPAAVRPVNPRREPVAMELGEDDVAAEGCRYDNSGAVEIGICVPPPCQDASAPELGDPFLVNILWRTTALDPDNPPSGGYPVGIGGRTGVVVPGRNTANGRDDPQCGAGVNLSRGAGLVAVADGRFGTDPCELAQDLATLIAERAT